jgi:hypothetical protein
MSLSSEAASTKDAHQFLWARWDAMKVRTEQFAVRLQSFALQNEYPRHLTPDTLSSARIEAPVLTSRQTSWDPRHPVSTVNLYNGAHIQSFSSHSPLRAED